MEQHRISGLAEGDLTHSFFCKFSRREMNSSGRPFGEGSQGEVQFAGAAGKGQEGI